MNHVNALGIMEYLQLQIHDFLELELCQTGSLSPAIFWARKTNIA